jgi:hypothetical protein
LFLCLLLLFPPVFRTVPVPAAALKQLLAGGEAGGPGPAQPQNNKGGGAGVAEGSAQGQMQQRAQKPTTPEPFNMPSCTGTAPVAVLGRSTSLGVEVATAPLSASRTFVLVLYCCKVGVYVAPGASM